MKKLIWLVVIIVLSISACKVKQLIEPDNPRDAYSKSLDKAGLAGSELGKQWIKAGEDVLKDSLVITLPYKESAYMFQHEANAFSWRFNVKRGRKVIVNASAMNNDSLHIFTELFRIQPGTVPDLVAYSGKHDRVEFIAEEDESLMLRVQPELLAKGRLTVTVTTEASLGFPVAGKNSSATGSFWGADRDGGARRHKGVDIFAPKGTPVIAVEDGIITRTGENRLGGKVVWLSVFSEGKSIYYAHLDTHLVQPGARVKKGDTLGLVGNTGNAQFTAPHLHFGIYSKGGAIDPFPFIENKVRDFPQMKADASLAGEWMRIKRKLNTKLFAGPDAKAKAVASIASETPLIISGAAGSWLRVRLPDGQPGYVQHQHVEKIDKELRNKKTASPYVVYDIPASSAAMIDTVEESAMAVYGEFNGHYLVRHNDKYAWTPKQTQADSTIAGK